MSEAGSPAAPGPLLARGRDADVYDVGDGWVLRRVRDGRSQEGDAAVLRMLHAAGYPVPRVRAASGPDVEMERVDGPTMLAELGRRPWRVRRHARLLAELHDRLHSIDAPPGLPVRCDGRALLHCDLHPLNVILSPRGPVVIDWANAARGDGAWDVAQSWIILATSVIDGPPLERWLGSALRSVFVRAFVGAGGRAAARARLPEAAAHRLADRNVLPAERVAIEHLLARETG